MKQIKWQEVRAKDPTKKVEHIRLTDDQQCLLRVGLRRVIDSMADIPALSTRRDAAIELLGLVYANEIEISHPAIPALTFEEFCAVKDEVV